MTSDVQMTKILQTCQTCRCRNLRSLRSMQNCVISAGGASERQFQPASVWEAKMVQTRSSSICMYRICSSSLMFIVYVCSSEIFTMAIFLKHWQNSDWFKRSKCVSGASYNVAKCSKPVKHTDKIVHQSDCLGDMTLELHRMSLTNTVTIQFIRLRTMADWLPQNGTKWSVFLSRTGGCKCAFGTRHCQRSSCSEGCPGMALTSLASCFSSELPAAFPLSFEDESNIIELS